MNYYVYCKRYKQADDASELAPWSDILILFAYDSKELGGIVYEVTCSDTFTRWSKVVK